MRVSFYMVSLLLLLGASFTKDWYYLAVVGIAILLGIADQAIEAYKSRVVNVNLSEIHVKSNATSSLEGGGNG